MTQPTESPATCDPYAVAHLVARLQGEAADHPRQVAIRGLEAEDCDAREVADYNRWHEVEKAARAKRAKRAFDAAVMRAADLAALARRDPGKPVFGSSARTRPSGLGAASLAALRPEDQHTVPSLLGT